MNKNIMIGAVVVVAVIGIYMVVSKNSNDEAIKKEEAAIEAAKKAAAPATQPKLVNVTMKDFAFSEKVLRVPLGTTVRWTNLDLGTHIVMSDSGYFDSKALGQGKSFEYTFTAKAVYPYKCSLHPNMTATVIVE